MLQQTLQDAAIQSFPVVTNDASASLHNATECYRIKIVHRVVSMLMLCGELQILFIAGATLYRMLQSREACIHVVNECSQCTYAEDSSTMLHLNCSNLITFCG